jgi:hypothetical protein
MESRKCCKSRSGRRKLVQICSTDFDTVSSRGLYIGKYTSLGGVNISRCHLGGKILTGEVKNRENVKEKEERRKKKRK